MAGQGDLDAVRRDADDDRPSRRGAARPRPAGSSRATDRLEGMVDAARHERQHRRRASPVHGVGRAAGERERALRRGALHGDDPPRAGEPRRGDELQPDAAAARRRTRSRPPRPSRRCAPRRRAVTTPQPSSDACQQRQRRRDRHGARGRHDAALGEAGDEVEVLDARRPSASCSRLVPSSSVPAHARSPATLQRLRLPAAQARAARRRRGRSRRPRGRRARRGRRPPPPPRRRRRPRGRAPSARVPDRGGRRRGAGRSGTRPRLRPGRAPRPRAAARARPPRRRAASRTACSTAARILMRRGAPPARRGRARRRGRAVGRRRDGPVGRDLRARRRRAASRAARASSPAGRTAPRCTGTSRRPARGAGWPGARARWTRCAATTCGRRGPASAASRRPPPIPPASTTSGWRTSTPPRSTGRAPRAACAPSRPRRAAATCRPAAARSPRRRRSAAAPRASRRRAARAPARTAIAVATSQRGSRSPAIRQPWFASTMSSIVRPDRVAHRLDDLDVVAPVGVVEAELDRPHARGRAAPATRRARSSGATSSPLDAYASMPLAAPAEQLPERLARAAAPTRSQTATSAIHGRPPWKSTVSKSSRTTSVRRGSSPTSSRASSVRVGQVVAAREALRAVVGGDDDERRVRPAARHGIPGRAEGRVERDPYAASRARRSRSLAMRTLAPCSTRWTPPRGDRPARAPPRPTRATASRIAAAVASRFAVFSAVSSRPRRTPRRRRAARGRSTCSAGSVPSATQSSTPCAMPSCAAPQVRRASSPRRARACSC